MPKPFPIIRESQYGEPPINFWPAEDDARKMVLIGSPGLDSKCTLTDCTEGRGIYFWNDYFYAVARRGSSSILFRLTEDGTQVELGEITTSYTGPVWMFNNTRQLWIVDGVWGYTYTPATGVFQSITDSDFTGAAAAAYQDTYGLYVIPDSQGWGISNSNDFTAYYADDLYYKEGATDNIKSILSDGVNVYLFGERTMEPWQNTGGANTSTANATFQRDQGGVFRYGCGAAKTPCNFDNTPSWLSDVGEWLRFVGNTCKIVSPDMFTRDVKKMASFSDANAFVYKHDGHSFMQINFTVGDMTWVMDAKTGIFHKKASYRQSGVGWGRHRLNCAASNDVGEIYGLDYENGKFYHMSTDYYDDDGEEMPGILHSQDVDFGLDCVVFPNVQLMMESGVGLVTGQGSDPQAMLEISNDGGKTWDADMGWRSMGAIGNYNYASIWDQMGSDYRRMYRWTITDPVKRKVLGIDWGAPWNAR